MKKKILAITLCLIMIISATACSTKTSSDDVKKEDTTKQEETVKEDEKKNEEVKEPETEEITTNDNTVSEKELQEIYVSIKDSVKSNSSGNFDFDDTRWIYFAVYCGAYNDNLVAGTPDAELVLDEFAIPQDAEIKKTIDAVWTGLKTWFDKNGNYDSDYFMSIVEALQPFPEIPEHL